MSLERHLRVLALLDISSPSKSYHSGDEIVFTYVKIAHLLQVIQQCKTSLLFQVICSGNSHANVISSSLNVFKSLRPGKTCEEALCHEPLNPDPRIILTNIALL